MASLILCPSCNRHLRTSESACPFCSADVRAAIANAAPRPIPTGHLSRAAMMAFAAANLGVTACGGDARSDTGVPALDGSPGGSNAGAGGTSTGGFVSVPHYGNPMLTGGATSSGGVPGTGGINTGGFVALPPYGVPIWTGGAPSSGGATNTGGASGGSGGTTSAGGASGGTGGFMILPPYGIPPPPTGGASNVGGSGGAAGSGNAAGTGGTMAVPAYGLPPPKPPKP